MNSIKELINVLRQRTPMYIGRKSISCLKAFIDGWYFRNPNDISDLEIMSKFQEWLQHKYKITTTHSWCDIILFYSQDESDALEKFFKEFDNFIEINDNQSIT